jgi:hypothetical protein
MRSVYSLTEHGEFLCLVDSGKGRSITNDAEAVVADLAAAGHDLARKRVLYRDTMGLWDELVVKDGQFSHFAPIHERDVQSAIIKARSGAPSDAAALAASLFAGADAQKESPDLQKDSRQQDRGGRAR